jgi:hypothetical protein
VFDASQSQMSRRTSFVCDAEPDGSTLSVPGLCLTAMVSLSVVTTKSRVGYVPGSTVLA